MPPSRPHVSRNPETASTVSTRPRPVMQGANFSQQLHAGVLGAFSLTLTSSTSTGTIRSDRPATAKSLRLPGQPMMGLVHGGSSLKREDRLRRRDRCWPGRRQSRSCRAIALSSSSFSNFNSVGTAPRASAPNSATHLTAFSGWSPRSSLVSVARASSRRRSILHMASAPPTELPHAGAQQQFEGHRGGRGRWSDLAHTLTM